MSTLNYVVVPSFLLHEWVNCYPDLVISNLYDDGRRNMQYDAYGALAVPRHDLLSLLRWLPPNSTVAVSYADSIEPFDAQIEEALLRLGIDTIYCLDDAATFPHVLSGEEKLRLDLPHR